MSHSEAADGAGDETLVEAGSAPLQDADGRDDTSATAPPSGREPTGDEAVDDVLGQLDEVAGEPLDTQIEVGERVHHVLQGRLADLAKE